MNALADVSTWIARLMDLPLGWLLDLPRDVAIAIVAVATSLLLTLVRKWTTRQDHLRRCRDDARRLKQLIRQARKAKDRAAVLRHRKTLGMVGGMRLRAEGLPLVVSLGPIVLLAVWAVERLDYVPPRVGEDVVVRAYYPVSSVGRLTHLVPPAGAALRSDAIQLVQLDPKGERNGLATWKLCASEPLESAPLLIRHEGTTARHPLSAGGRVCGPPVVAHDDGLVQATAVELRRAKFLGIVPGIPAIAFPPWLVAYLVIVIPLVPLLRRVLRVY